MTSQTTSPNTNNIDGTLTHAVQQAESHLQSPDTDNSSNPSQPQKNQPQVTNQELKKQLDHIEDQINNAKTDNQAHASDQSSSDSQSQPQSSDSPIEKLEKTASNAIKTAKQEIKQVIPNKNNKSENDPNEKQENNKQPADQVKKIIQEWPEEIQKIVNWMIDKYDQPDQLSSTQAIWINNKPWNYSVISSESIPHKFPYEHGDNLEQTINYRVPPHKANELLKFNGSLTIRHTRGTLSIESGSEPLNIATLNLAHKICQNQLNIDQARTQLAQTAKQLQDNPNNPPEIAQQLQFDQPHDTFDSDQPHQIFLK